MQDLIGILGLGGYGLALLAGVFALLPKKGSLETQRITELREDLTSTTERVDRIEGLLIWYRRRDVAWQRYVATIQTGAERGEMPPWPELTGILAEVRHD